MKDTTVYILATLAVIAAISYAMFLNPADAQMHPGLTQYSHMSKAPLENGSTTNVAQLEQAKSNCSGIQGR
jgi:hypothetical protein